MTKNEDNSQLDKALDEELNIEKDINNIDLAVSESKELIFPGIVERVKAAFADGVIIILMMLMLSEIFSRFENVPDSARIIGFVFIFGLYDPIFTSLFGGTLGHFSMKLRVKRINQQSRNILLPFALLRFFIKALLGWISLLTVGSSEKRQTMHDIASGSIVLYKDQVK